MSVAGTGTEGSEAQAGLIEHLVAQLAERDAKLAERDERLAAREEKLAERDARLAELEAQASALKSERDRLVRAYELLKEELLLVKRRLFIAKAERVDTSQLELEFAALSRKLEELAGDVPPEDDDDEGRRPSKRRPKGRRNLAETNLPEVTVEVPDELCEQLVAEGKAERIGFDLDEHFRVDERVDLHHRRRRRMRAEGFGVGLAELLPARDVGDEHASADYVLESGAQFGESAGDDLDTAPCLAFTFPVKLMNPPNDNRMEKPRDLDVVIRAARPIT